MRRIVTKHVAIDDKGFAWEFEVTVPWIDRPTDDVQYGEGKAHGPETPVIIMNTPNDPEHWSYGEDGPRFDLSTLKSLVAKAERATAEAQRLDGKSTPNFVHVPADPNGV